ncbi:putative signal transducing protein [Filimonas effusa]|uniref:DUF2007 domain-containing protein n=1 Tax=Filimonas effusa TaxID=2508721 RepID=A0A4Q1CZL4_9BACT|nr:DUF2007 domain-containing protein [Filimonas effusa]RXK80850.1 hypothetical protein ESB13_22100 [Filimonas effusa]
MTQAWFLLFRTSDFTKASIIKGMLEENRIRVVLLNKRDSSYLNFGDVELYVPAHLKDIARHLMDNTLMN